MAASAFEIEVSDEAVHALLANLTARMNDLTPAMRPISQLLLDSIEEAFRLEADPVTGAAWAPLSPHTIAAREKTGNWPGKILQRLGHLAGSMSASSGADFAAAGTNVVYAITHQVGAAKGAFGATKKGQPIPFGDIPARPFAGASPEAVESILDVLQRHLMGT
jgi:phage virion morphogenesis protein